MPDKRYTKVEEEIIQILDRMDDGPTPRPRPRPRPNLRLVKQPAARRRWNAGELLRRSPLLFLIGSLALALLALSLRGTSSTLATALAIGAFLSFFAPLLLARRHSAGSSPIEGKMWRGRDIVVTPPPGESPLERARAWWELRRRR